MSRESERRAWSIDWHSVDADRFVRFFPGGAEAKTVAQYVGCSRTLVHKIERSALQKLNLALSRGRRGRA